MPKDYPESHANEGYHERHRKRRSRHHRSQKHDDSRSSSLTQESEDLYGPPPETDTYSPQMMPPDRSLTLSPVSQVLQDRRTFRKENPRSASSPVRQKYVYSPQEIPHSATSSSTSQTEGSTRRTYSIQNSRQDPQAEPYKNEEDTDSHARPKSRPEAGQDKCEQHAPTTPKRGSRNPRSTRPPSSYPSERHKRSPQKSQPAPPSLPSFVDVKDFAHDPECRPRTKRGSYRESREDLGTPSPSAHMQATRTEPTTDISYAEENTDYTASRTVSTTEQDQSRKREIKASVEYERFEGTPADPQIGRSVGSEPDNTDRSEAVTSVSANRSNVLDPADHRFFEERFADLQYICPGDFREELKTWEEYAAMSRKAGHDVSPSVWFYAQRKKVMRRFLWLTEFCDDYYRPVEL